MRSQNGTTQNGEYQTMTSRSVPWAPAELRRFWGLARNAGLDTESVRGMLFEHFGKISLHDLTRTEFLGAIRALITKQDPAYGRATPFQWARIKWLQHKLGWTDRHMEHYIKKHRMIDSVRFLDAPSARDVITALEKIWRYYGRRR